MAHGWILVLGAGAGATSTLAATFLVEFLKVWFDPSRRAKLHRRSAGERIKSALG